MLSGPREGFTEGIMNNLSMLRRRMRSSELKIKFFNKGRLTRTTVCVVYIESVVNKNILKELYRRLEGIDIDGVLIPITLKNLSENNRLSALTPLERRNVRMSLS